MQQFKSQCFEAKIVRRFLGVPNMTSYTFRDFLLDEMKRRDMSASKLARFFGVDPSTVTRAIDARDPKSPGFEFLLKVSRATHKNLYALLEIAYPDEINATGLSPSAQILAQQIEELPESDVNAIRRMLRGGKEPPIVSGD